MNVSSPAYVLHRRPYQNTGLIVNFLTLEYGRVDVVAQGAQRVSKGKRRYALDFFQELNVECKGKTELLSLRSAESMSSPLQLVGKKLFCALYVNELLTRLLPRHEEVSTVYLMYQAIINNIGACQGMAEMEWLLRKFEWGLLSELGYGIPLCDAGTGEMLIEDQTYVYKGGLGFAPSTHQDKAMTGDQIYTLSHLLSEQGADAVMLTEENRTLAKQLLRHAIASVLDGAPLKSRELFV